MSNFLKQWRLSRNLSQEQVAEGVGTEKTQISKLERGDRKLTTDWLERLAGFYRVAPAALLAPPPVDDQSAQPASGAPHEAEPPSNVSERVAPATISGLPLDVPEMGTAVGGNHGDFSLNGQVIDYKPRPPGIANNRNVFCLRVRGDSMSPKYEEGDLIYVSPNRPTKAGDDVLVEMKPKVPGEPGNAYVKRLVTKTPTKLVLRQFNPANDRIELQQERILRICYVFTTADLLRV